MPHNKMKVKTQLEQALEANPDYSFAKSRGGTTSEIQEVLDNISTVICESLDPLALLAHNHIAYEDTALAYAYNPEHGNIPDALIDFMTQLGDSALVLDIGCGAGRDAVFMALQDIEIRKRFMRRMKDGKTALERFGVPTMSFYTLGIDASESMVQSTRTLARSCGLAPQNDTCRAEFSADTEDMHFLRASNVLGDVFSGAWSSAALFMHTPEPLIATALSGVAHVLMHGGIFGVSYSNNPEGTPYDNLRYSRTGEIKYFSRPSKELIAVTAADAGLLLLQEDYSDLEMGGEAKKDFFVTQLFKKVS